VTERRERRRKKLLDNLKEKRGYRKLKEEALDRTLWRTGFVCHMTDNRINLSKPSGYCKFR
jgi:hypothetical protein